MIRGALSGLLVGTMRRRGASFGPGSGVGGGPSTTLDLNFAAMAASGTLDSRVTYSGASLATLTDATGAIAYKPHNLLTYSEQFDNAIWAKTTASVTANSAAAPDGTSTADKLVEDTTASTAHFIANTVTVSSGVPHTLSVYLKAAGRSWVGVYETSSACGKYFNLATGVVGSDLGSAPAAFAITDVGNGWFRCYIKVTTASTSSTFRVFAANADGGITYSGDGTSGVYIWGAQLNIGPLQPYYPTTSAAYYGPRFTYDPVTHAALGLLIEEQRTNLLTWSEAFDNAAWTGLGTSATANATTAPDGNTTADKVVAAATTNWHGTRQTAVTLTSGVAATLSVYAKAAEETKVAVSDYAIGTTGVIFDLSAVTAVVIGSDAGLSLSNPTITNVGGGWYRCAVTMTASVAGRIPMIYLRQYATSYVGDGASGVYIWGAQLEAGAFATSYIPTTSASVTRAADSATMTGSNFSSWFNATQGTFVTESAYAAAASGGAMGVISANGGANNGYLFYKGAGTASVNAYYDATAGTSIGSVTAGAATKLALAYGATGVACMNGGSVVSAGAISVSTPNQLQFGKALASSYQFTGTISRLRYYNTALTNAQLQALTT